VKTRMCSRHLNNGVSVPAGPGGLCGPCAAHLDSRSRALVRVPEPAAVVLSPQAQQQMRDMSAAASERIAAARQERLDRYLTARELGMSHEEAAGEARVKPETAASKYEPAWLEITRAREAG
jgi:hypothetical protein